MIYKYVSSREVIDKFFGDTNYDEDIPFADVIRWIAEALDMIAVKMQYIRKVAGDKTCPYLTIVDYKAQLPCDFFQLEQLTINGMPALPSNSTMMYMVGKDCCTPEQLMQEVTNTYTDNFGNIFLTNYPQESLKNGSSVYEYDINDNFITTNAKEGYICMSYLAYPVDEEGLPMIPDDVYYLQAVASYIRTKMDYRAWRRQGTQFAKQLYDDSNRDWLWYVGSARGAGLKQDPSTMESLMGSFVSIIPKLPKHNRYYRF